ncbi:MAG: flagellar basal body P-ring protein FlgI [Vicinamibacterales bacterium]
MSAVVAVLLLGVAGAPAAAQVAPAPAPAAPEAAPTAPGVVPAAPDALPATPEPAPAPPVEQVSSSALRIKDVASLQGLQPVPLVGYGLVIGLSKTGDRRQTLFSAQSLANVLERFGVSVPAAEMKIENIAAVLVTAELSPYSRSGARIDVTASSIGDARSLQGGTLLATPLRGPDGTVHALAQGPLTLGGFGGGAGGNSVQVNHLTVGRVPGGALVQVGQRAVLPAGDELLLSLASPDFVTAHRLAESVSAELGPDSARALDAATVAVHVPAVYRGDTANLMARLELLPVELDRIARIVINERTGTVVVGGGVKLGPAAVAHGSLSVRIATSTGVSQPQPFSTGGQTTVVQDQQVDVQEGQAQLIELEPGTTLDAVVRALNALGATPRDVMAILQALKAAGAITAEIVVI